MVGNNKDWRYKGRADDFFQLDVFRVGSTEQLTLEALMSTKYTTRKNRFPEEKDKPKSLGLPHNGCEVITCIGKIPRVRKPAERAPEGRAPPNRNNRLRRAARFLRAAARRSRRGGCGRVACLVCFLY